MTARSAPAVLLAVAAAAVLALTSCTSAPPAPAGPGGTTAASAVVPVPYPTPRPDTVGGSRPQPPAAAAPARDATPDTVAAAGLRVLYTWDTGSDSGPASAARRALALLSPPMSTDVLNAPPVAQPGAQWDQWARHAAVLTAAVTAGADDHPPDTPDRVYRQYAITQTIRGADGWSAPAQQLTVFVTLERTPSGWRIATVSSA